MRISTRSRRSPEIARAVSALLRVLSVCAPVALGSPSIAAAQAAAPAALTADIPTQALAQALEALANQTGLQLVYLSTVVRNKKSHAVSAGVDAEPALQQLLKGTGLTFQHLRASSVRIVAAPIPASDSRSLGAMSEGSIEVVVTGTRLATSNENAISPVISVSSAEIAEMGLTRLEDVLGKLSMFSPSTSATVNNFADGTAAVNLRGLGNQRTLVLVNGTRLGPGSADGRNWSDVNQIPAALVERVDVLTGGASAVYGADAVAGVVNFIINTNFEGVRVDASYHLNQHSNSGPAAIVSLINAAGNSLPPSTVATGFGKTASVILGTGFDGNRGTVTGYVTYDSQAATLQSKFDYSVCGISVPFAGAALGCSGSDTSRGGRFVAFSESGTLLDDTVDPMTGALRPYAASDVYNYSPVSYFQVPSERWNGGAFMKYDFGPQADGYASVMYMRHSMSAQSAPSGDFGASAFIPCADPLLTAQEVGTLCTAANLAANGGNYETYGGKNYPGIDLAIFRRNVEGGNRISTFINDATRAVVGVKGGAGDGWAFDIYAELSTVRASESDQNMLGDSQITEALNVLPGPNGHICGGQAGTAFTPNPKCTPWNIWLPNGVSAASLAFLSVPSFTTGRVTEQVVSGSATVDLGKFGAKLSSAEQGVQLNVGAEWRKDQLSFVPNDEQQQGNVAGNPITISAIAGKFTVKEAFTEVRLPLAAKQVLAEELFADAGVRYSRYSNGFDSDTYKLGLQWAPMGAIRLRGGFHHAVRAPNIGELFSQQSINPNDGTVDPCAGTPTASLAACELSGVRPAQYGHVRPLEFGSYNGLTGGNPRVRPEVANTRTLGFVFRPSLVQDFALGVDYFDIRIEGVIGVTGADTILRNCLASVGNPAQAARFCSLVHRDAQGSLWLSPSGYISDLLVNEGELATRGVDVNGRYRLALRTAGSLTFTLVGTRLQRLRTTPVAGLGSYDCAGYFGWICGVAAPRWRHMLDATWSTPGNGVAVGLRWRFVGSAESALTDPSPFLSGTSDPLLSHIPSYSYVDLIGTIELGRHFALRLGVNNIADKTPPVLSADECYETPSGLCNGNTFPGLYDAMGRYLFVNLSAQW